MVESEKRDVFMIQKEEFITVRSIDSGTIYKRMDGILIFRQIKGRDSVTLDELKEQLKVFLEIQKGELSPVLIVVDGLKKLDSEEKMFLTSTITQFASKIAIVTYTPVPTFIFNIFLFLSRPAIPSKMFSSEKEALEWLKLN
jgi:hypothetical protein